MLPLKKMMTKTYRNSILLLIGALLATCQLACSKSRATQQNSERDIQETKQDDATNNAPKQAPPERDEDSSKKGGSTNGGVSSTPHDQKDAVVKIDKPSPQAFSGYSDAVESAAVRPSHHIYNGNLDDILGGGLNADGSKIKIDFDLGHGGIESEVIDLVNKESIGSEKTPCRGRHYFSPGDDCLFVNYSNGGNGESAVHKWNARSRTSVQINAFRRAGSIYYQNTTYSFDPVAEVLYAALFSDLYNDSLVIGIDNGGKIVSQFNPGPAYEADYLSNEVDRLLLATDAGVVGIDKDYRKLKVLDKKTGQITQQLDLPNDKTFRFTMAYDWSWSVLYLIAHKKDTAFIYSLNLTNQGIRILGKANYEKFGWSRSRLIDADNGFLYYIGYSGSDSSGDTGYRLFKVGIKRKPNS